jgi:seryl-tRNA synthetase
MSNAQGGESRQMHHQIALLKAERNQMSVNLENLQSVAQAQSEESRVLRSEVESLKAKLTHEDKSKKEISAQMDSSNMVIKTLQSQLMELQKSDTILR